MPTPKRGPRLGAGPAHQKLLLANLASDLFRHGQVRTTQTRARTLRPYAEKLITKAKGGSLHDRRQVLSKLRDRDVVAYLFEEVAPRFADRPGGYTRVLKLGPRPGDNAPMALVQLVEQGEGSGEDAIEVEKSRRSRGLFGRRRKRRGQPSVGEGAAAATIAEAADLDADTVVDETTVDEDEERQAVQVPPADEDPAADAAGDDDTADSAAESDEPDAGDATGKDAGAS